MTDINYRQLKLVDKQLDHHKIETATNGSMKNYWGHSIFNSQQKFRVIQCRNGHRNKNKLSYVLTYKNTTTLIRVDINGKPHKGVPCPHAHIYSDKHPNGEEAISLSKIKNYTGTDDVILSLKEFLNYCNFITKGLVISNPLDI
ncbi:DUF6978 family protein [Fructilactobacillus cliffordii]|uniref:Bacterial toxin 24 domain-containing protein n=1 Tax=Fructilactobacillus cliffordii TaxID=2940299 RepID=A0A9Q8ZPW9_9LACO|nr:polymorphic toxin type 24 domain-containing protein [Fructilactobacillus cliffordii]USS89395.1 hypothetical protein M3M40_00890 [Fructilactobacillus cliffordii]